MSMFKSKTYVEKSRFAQAMRLNREISCGGFVVCIQMSATQVKCTTKKKTQMNAQTTRLRVSANLACGMCENFK